MQGQWFLSLLILGIDLYEIYLVVDHSFTLPSNKCFSNLLLDCSSNGMDVKHKESRMLLKHEIVSEVLDHGGSQAFFIPYSLLPRR